MRGSTNAQTGQLSYVDQAPVVGYVFDTPLQNTTGYTALITTRLRFSGEQAVTVDVAPDTNWAYYSVKQTGTWVNMVAIVPSGFYYKLTIENPSITTYESTIYLQLLR